MTKERFVLGLWKHVIEEEKQLYASSLKHTDISNVTDPYWVKVLQLYNDLNESQRAILNEIVEQISVDAVSSLLGILDGVCFLDGAEGQFRLTAIGGGQLSGDLQEQFLMKQHNR